MPHCLGMVVVGETVTVVYAHVPADGQKPIEVLSDTTWKLQTGERGPALAVIHQRCTGFLAEHPVNLVVVKASALPTGAAKLAHLESAEVRGVVIAAAASACTVRIISKGVISRTYGERKVDEYVADDQFWREHTEGKALRKSSREAAMLILAAR